MAALTFHFTHSLDFFNLLLLILDYCICLYLVLSSCILIPHGLIQSDQRNGNMMFLTLCPSSSPFLTPIRMISPVACYHIKGRIEQSEGGSMNGSCMCWDHSLDGLSLLTYTIQYLYILSSTLCILTLLVIVCNPVIIIISSISIIPLSLHHFCTSFSYTNAVMRWETTNDSICIMNMMSHDLFN